MTRWRGFAMVLVLVLIVVLLALVVGQLASVQSQRLGAIRDKEESEATAVADHCLARASSYLDSVRAANNPTDFDSVLDPALNSHPAINGGSNDFSEDFVPTATFGGSIVYVPSAESGSTGLRQAMHRFRYVAMDGGGCLVRFDDNADDSSPGVGGDNASPAIEGQDVDIPYRDEDMGIYITAIGVYPVASGTAPADAYARAHARSTRKVFVSTGGAPGVVANGNLVIDTNVEICGVGGFQGNNLTYTGGGSATNDCSCGDVATVAGAAPPNTCNYGVAPGNKCDPSIPCQPGAQVTLVSPPPVNVVVPTPVHWLQLDGFQDPTNPKGLGDNGVCEFYFREDNVLNSWTMTPFNDAVANNVEANFMSTTTEHGEIFVWDHTDNDAQGCMDDNKSLAACPAARIMTHNCKDPAMASTSYLMGGQKIVKRPCAWKWVDNAGVATNPAQKGPHVFCDATLTEQVTPCWKLVAEISSDTTPIRAVVLQDFPVGAEGPAPGANEIEDTGVTGGFSEILQPHNGEKVPNIEAIWGDARNGAVGNDGTAASIAANYWTTLCGACPNCATANGWGLKGDEHFHFEQNPMCSADFFDRSILVFENQAHPLSTNNDDGRFHVKASWGAAACGGPVHHTIISQSHADMDQNTRICRVWSNCSTFPPTPCNATMKGRNNGFVVRAGGECYVDQGAVFIGNFQCGNIQINQGTGADCIVGDLIAFNDQSAIPVRGQPNVCSSPGAPMPPCTEGVCIKNAVNLVGDIYSDGDVCVQQGVHITGSILAGGDGTGNVFINTNTVINGQLVSEGQIGIGTNVQINNPGTGVFGARVTSGLVVESPY